LVSLITLPDNSPDMIILKKPDDLQLFLKKKRRNEIRVGFVPTMGALHAGHLSLIKASKEQNEITVCSIFVNPAQFNDPEDFKKYPVTVERDIELLELAGCDIAFIPSVGDIYPTGITVNHYEIGLLETQLEGKYRPGHFQGVCRVMHRLLEIVLPNNLYLGQKDYQQCMVIKKLIEIIGLTGLVKLITCPTLREKDGLAMSSRNTRLNEKERKKAVVIYQALSYIFKNLRPGKTGFVLDESLSMLEKDGFKTDYLTITDADTLQTVEDWDGRQKIVALAAAFINKVRLIDNMIIK
jgi:pantoate--beta-alanine ligase